jgi:hypothetical protein
MLEWLSLPAVWGIVKGLPRAKTTVEHYRLEWVAGNLAWLSFWNNGVRPILQKIADGEGTKADIAKISGILKTDEQKVTKIASKLSKNAQTIVSARFGISVGHALDMIVYKKVGPDALRDRLLAFVENSEALPLQAQMLLSQIDEFDHELATIHQQLRGTGSGKAVLSPKVANPARNQTPRKRDRSRQTRPKKSPATRGTRRK